jgi:steroid delta-isomerase-like uncharacterized protein
MGTEENTATVRQFIEDGISRGNLDVLDDILDPEYVCYNAGVPEPVRGRDNLKESIRWYKAAFPDLTGTIEDLVATDDKVVARERWHGTHQGEFEGIPASGNAIDITGVDIFRLENGKVVEQWSFLDMLSLMQQVGALPGQVQA